MCGTGHLRFRTSATIHPFDRTPLYAELARLESEFQQALGPRRKIRMTIAEMLLDDGVLS